MLEKYTASGEVSYRDLGGWTVPETQTSKVNEPEVIRMQGAQ